MCVWVYKLNIRLSRQCNMHNQFYVIQTYQKNFPSDSLRAVIALESLLPDDHRVLEPHISYNDTGGKII